MKKIYILIISLVLISSGCTEFITLKPQDELIREEYWKTEIDVINVVGESYAKMATILDDVYYWSELRGGLISPDPKRVKPTTLEFFNFNINQHNDKVKWGNFYVVINLANTIIEYAPLAKENDQTFTQEAYDGYIAEAYFIRSLCYFYLVKSFQEVPFITKSYAKDDQDFSYAKSTEEEIINQILFDLNGITDLAFDTDFFIITAKQKGRVTLNAVYALLADIYLWNNEYQNCIDACRKISGDVFLVNGDNYFSLYGGSGNSPESILELQFDYNLYQTVNEYDDDDSKTNNLYTLTSNNSSGKKETFVSEYLTGLFGSSDLRQYGTNGDVTYHSEVLSIWKYEGHAPYDPTSSYNFSRSSYRSDANWIFYRLADIRLMMAEAYAEMDDVSSALEQLNIVRIRAGIPKFGDSSIPTQKNLLNEILDERAREFVGEGKRWFDLVRVTRRDVNNRLNLISEAVISNVDARSRSAVASKIKDVNSWFLPIHNDELILNKLLVQNPFYE